MRHLCHAMLLWAVFAAAGVAAGPAAPQTSLYDLLEKAIFTEETVGDLDKAIELYEEVVARTETDRPHGAQAQFRLGMCHLKKGNTDRAVAALQKLVADFPKQAELVQRARERLTALGHPYLASNPSGRPAVRMLLSDRDTGDTNDLLNIRLSPDGGRVAYSRFAVDGALCVRELSSGKVTKLTAGEPDDWVLDLRWSPDGRRIAYSGQREILRIVDLDSMTTSEVPKPEGVGLFPLDWSRDGTSLLCDVHRKDGSYALALASLPDGVMTFLPSEGWDSNGTAVLSPNGRYVAFSTAKDGRSDVFVMTLDGSARHRVTSDIGGGERPLWSPTGETLVYTNADGLWAQDLAEGRTRGEPRLVHEAIERPLSWTRGGGLSFVKSGGVSRNFALPVDPETAKPTGPPVVLDLRPDSANRFAWSPDMKTIAFTSRDDDDIHLYNPADGASRALPTRLDRYPSNFWWSGDGREVLLATRSEDEGGKNIVALNASDGSRRDLFPRTTGVERFRTSADDRTVVFFKHTGNRYDGRRLLMVADLGSKDGRVLVREEEVGGEFSNWVRPMFSPDGTRVLFATADLDRGNNELWIVSTDGSDRRRLATVTFDPEGPTGGGSGKPFLHSAVWDPSGRFIVYDDSKSLFVVNVETGEPQAMPSVPGYEGVSLTHWSPDGKWIGHTRWTENYELWTIDNVFD